MQSLCSGAIGCLRHTLMTANKPETAVQGCSFSFWHHVHIVYYMCMYNYVVGSPALLSTHVMSLHLLYDWSFHVCVDWILWLTISSYMERVQEFTSTQWSMSE